jgi:maltose-binding protein MalE
MSEGIPVDLITVDQIWLGKFAENGLLTDLTNYTQKWADPLIGMKSTGTEELIMIKYTLFGHGRM